MQKMQKQTNNQTEFGFGNKLNSNNTCLVISQNKLVFNLVIVTRIDRAILTVISNDVAVARKAVSGTQPNSAKKNRQCSLQKVLHHSWRPQKIASRT